MRLGSTYLGQLLLTIRLLISKILYMCQLKKKRGIQKIYTLKGNRQGIQHACERFVIA